MQIEKDMKVHVESGKKYMSKQKLHRENKSEEKKNMEGGGAKNP